MLAKERSKELTVCNPRGEAIIDPDANERKVRTALSQFSFALIIIKIFTAEFYSIGALFAVYGVGVLLLSAYRRMAGK